MQLDVISEISIIVLPSKVRVSNFLAYFKRVFTFQTVTSPNKTSPSPTPLDCSQSPYFSVGFSRPVRFDGAAAILVCKSERDLGRVSKLHFPSPTILTPTPAPLGSLDTLPRSRSLLQTKMAAIPSSRESHGKIGGL